MGNLFVLALLAIGRLAEVRTYFYINAIAVFPSPPPRRTM